MRLSPSEAEVYRRIQQGAHPKEITDMSVHVVRHCINKLKDAGLIKQQGVKGKKQHYEAVPAEYTVDEPPSKQPELVLDTSPDPLIRRAAKVQLCEDRMFYLKNHLHEPRSVLAKKLGLRKIEVTVLLAMLA